LAIDFIFTKNRTAKTQNYNRENRKENLCELSALFAPFAVARQKKGIETMPYSIPSYKFKST